MRCGLLQALLAAKEARDASGWQRFQHNMQTLKLQRTRMQREAEDVQVALLSAYSSQGESGKICERLKY